MSGEEDGSGAEGGTGVGGGDGEGAACEVDAVLGVIEEGEDGVVEFGGVGDLDGGVGGEPAGDDGGEVLHLGAEEDGFPGEGWFDGILATGSSEAFPDEDDGGEGIPGAEFAGGIDEEGIGNGGGGLEERELGAADEVDWEVGEFFEEVWGSLGVAWDEDEEEGGVEGAELEEDLGEDEFFAWESASREEDWGILGEVEGVEEVLAEGDRGWGRGWGVEFGVACEVDAVGGDAEIDPSGAVCGFGDGEGIEEPEEWTGEGLGAEEASGGAWGESRKEGDGDAEGFRGGEKIWPDGFDEDESIWVEDVEGFSDDEWGIDGVIDDLERGGCVGLSEGESGGGGDGEDEGFIGEEEADLGDDLEGEEGFADADGVDPDGILGGESGEIIWGEEGEALGEFFAIAASAEDAEKEGGKKSEED